MISAFGVEHDISKANTVRAKGLSQEGMINFINEVGNHLRQKKLPNIEIKVAHKAPPHLPAKVAGLGLLAGATAAGGAYATHKYLKRKVNGKPKSGVIKAFDPEERRLKRQKYTSEGLAAGSLGAAAIAARPNDLSLRYRTAKQNAKANSIAAGRRMQNAERMFRARTTVTPIGGRRTAHVESAYNELRQGVKLGGRKTSWSVKAERLKVPGKNRAAWAAGATALGGAALLNEHHRRHPDNAPYIGWNRPVDNARRAAAKEKPRSAISTGISGEDTRRLITTPTPNAPGQKKKKST